MVVHVILNSLLLKYHSLETSFSVTVEQKILKHTYSTPKTLCGMERTVVWLFNRCCDFSKPPWFCTELDQHTSDDIELRLCADEPTHNEDIPIEIIELYVQ